MEQPEVSVIMPVYNAARYLRFAIDSIIQQTFRQLELIIINDGSTDDSEQIILSYKDPRIVYVKNDGNKGLIYTLTLAINLAKGKYIARMDADDIAVLTRIEKQFEWLRANPQTTVVASLVKIITQDGVETGRWNDDQKTITYRQIKRTMKWRNCLAHPSVMFSAEVGKKYLYNPIQIGCEDFDLWLRIIGDGLFIEKIPENLLQYREHPTSVTGSTLRKKNPFFLQFRCKKNFLLHQISKYKWGLWEWQVLGTCVYDGIMGIGKNIKKQFTG